MMCVLNSRPRFGYELIAAILSLPVRPARRRSRSLFPDAEFLVPVVRAWAIPSVSVLVYGFEAEHFKALIQHLGLHKRQASATTRANNAGR